MLFAWVVSFVLWAPWIIGWQFIVQERTVPENDCYIQFIQVLKRQSLKVLHYMEYLPEGRRKARLK
jgi:hypothetical protein